MVRLISCSLTFKCRGPLQLYLSLFLSYSIDENSSLSASESFYLTNMDSDNDSTLTLDQTSSQQTNSWPRKKIKGRKEKEVEFFRDLSAVFCGILYQRRMLAVWQKRFCKVKDHCLICYRLVASGIIWKAFGSNIWKTFLQKAPSQMFDRVLNTLLSWEFWANSEPKFSFQLFVNYFMQIQWSLKLILYPIEIT